MRIMCFDYKYFFLQSPSPPQGKVKKKRLIASWPKQKFFIKVAGDKFLSKHIIQVITHISNSIPYIKIEETNQLVNAILQLESLPRRTTKKNLPGHL